MDDVTLIIQWDEVIGDVISHIMEQLSVRDEVMFEQIIGKPLIKGLIWIINQMLQYLQMPSQVFTWNQTIERILSYVYICCILGLGLQLLFEIGKYIVSKSVGDVPKLQIIRIIQNGLILQFVHIVCMPILGGFYDNYPKILQNMTRYFAGMSPDFEFQVSALPPESIFAEIFFLLLFFFLCIFLQFQWISYHLKLLVCFIGIYLRIITGGNERKSGEGYEKHIIILFCSYFLQQLFFIEVIPQFLQIKTIYDLVIISGVMAAICFIPHFIGRKI